MKDLWGNEIIRKTIKVNIYADEVQEKECPYTKQRWIYTGIIVENIENPLLPDILNERYCGNNDKNSPYFSKNDRIVHWVDIRDADSKNIAKRWLEYILSPDKSGNKFFGYVLGINISKLNIKEFDEKDQFNSIYNRFFRSAILYALKTFFPNKNIIVKNIYHEVGQQQHHEYFPWHSIFVIEKKENNITFEHSKIAFLNKNHRGKNEKSNLIQLCDIFLGVCVSLLDGIEKSKKSKYREELANLFLPLFQELIENPKNINNSYKHTNRIMIRFFPKERTNPNDIKRYSNQFFTNRKIYYKEQISKQTSLF